MTLSSNERTRRLVQILQLIATTQHVPTTTFPWADEVALILGEYWQLYQSVPADEGIGSDAEMAVEELDAILVLMSGEERANLWTVEAVATAPEWRAVRRLAAIALERAGVEIRKPIIHWDPDLSSSI